MKKILDGKLVDMTPEEIEAFLATQEQTPAEPSGLARTYKASMFRKMTDSEHQIYLQIRTGFSPRLQAIFDAAEYLSPDDEFWPALVEASEQAYGTERAAEILASTT